ncbi:EAL domain, c-di-GMP-specific phosphodiesterase class I (or its enzymatically inactive variant) [Deinococcus reticulitermitis]|uniref:EAL domain, c-di-GMP-specific phosphodiesterase class I (Or its enzymatically inactive variant) n=1 Tax=Deinococcus reticulitermitis TaxID=856736 RepID=A0A1H7APA6_9DEIO|nr:EAL domain-containing protein [Deinococcus reticulitermitis]SEJ66464.1 EAL domain, c-di-GMP-specific phosphodiesterase class I (or its enzymatically inactive variant) [Deinococcus reticulitermitis]
MLASHDVAFEPWGRAVRLPRETFPQLKAVLAGFSRTERADLRAAPPQAGEESPDPWQAAPFEQWVQRLDSRWFSTACQHLLFYLQPIVALSSGEVYGQEALVRACVEGELIGAGALLQAATVHDQARAFDAQARRVAIRTAYPQLAEGQVLFINFAPGVVYNPDVCLQTTFQACREVNADFSRLLFEVTESEAFPDLGLLAAILQRYRAEGAQVALDDLGAGQTSLTYLDALRPDLVKLDRGLIQGLHADDHRVPLIGALIAYAHDLGIRVVAEGIEREEELHMVRDLGADYAQGYFLGRPAPAPQHPGVSARASRMWTP